MSSRYFRVWSAMDEWSTGLVRYLEESQFDRWGDMSIRLARAEMAGEWITDWVQPTARLEGVGFCEYQDAIEGRWFAPAARAVLDRAFGESGVAVQWLPATLLSEDRSERRDYWLLHFPSSIDVADPQLSTSGPRGFIKIVLDVAKVGDRLAFPTPQPPDLDFFVAEPVMEDLLAVGVPLACFFAAPTNA